MESEAGMASKKSPFSPIPEREERRERSLPEVVDVRSPTSDSARRSRRMELPKEAEVEKDRQGEKDLEDATSVSGEEASKKKLLERKLKHAKRDLKWQKAQEGEESRKRAPSEDLASHIDPQVMTDQDPCEQGLWCKLYNQDGCKKWIGNLWAYKQHLQTKHKLGKEQASALADAQWQQLEKELGPVPAEQGKKQKGKGERKDVSPPDTRRPSEPSSPPSRAMLKPREAAERSPKMPRADPPPEGASSSSSRDQGLRLLRDMYADLADKILK